MCRGRGWIPFSPPEMSSAELQQQRLNSADYYFPADSSTKYFCLLSPFWALSFHEQEVKCSFSKTQRRNNFPGRLWKNVTFDLLPAGCHFWKACRNQHTEWPLNPYSSILRWKCLHIPKITSSSSLLFFLLICYSYNHFSFTMKKLNINSHQIIDS